MKIIEISQLFRSLNVSREILKNHTNGNQKKLQLG